MFYCPACMNEIMRPLPVEPVYTLDEVAVIVPISRNTLNQILKRERQELIRRYGEPLYKRTKGARYIRLLRAREVRYVRAIHFHERTENGYERIITIRDIDDDQISYGYGRGNETFAT